MIAFRHTLFVIGLFLSVLSIHTPSVALDQLSEAPAVEARLKKLSIELRCLVCQNSTLADSDAPLAQDLRNEIRKLIESGQTDEEIVAYLVARYGDFVTFRPPVNASTALLWFGPFVMLIIGLIVLVVVLKKRDAAIDAETGNH
jgi:cytochrome c-type biogenesis protein CcmH